MAELQLKTDEKGAPVMQDGKYVFTVDGKDEALDIGGLRETGSKYQKLSGDLDAKRTEAKALEAKIAALGEFADPVKVKALRDKAEELERAAAAAAAGTTPDALDAEFKRRTERLTADHQTQLEAATKRASAAEDAAKAKDALLESEVVNAGVAAAANSIANFTKDPVALRDLQRLARLTWKFENGQLVPRDEDGKIIYGGTAEVPITYREWLLSRPTLIGAGVNGGSAAGGANSNGNKTMTRAQFDALDQATKDERLKKGSGWTVVPNP